LLINENDNDGVRESELVGIVHHTFAFYIIYDALLYRRSSGCKGQGYCIRSTYSVPPVDTARS